MSKNDAQVYDCYRYLGIKIGHLSQIGEKDISNFQVENSGFSIDFSFSKTYLLSLSKIFLYINRVLDRFFKIEIVIVFSLEKFFGPVLDRDLNFQIVFVFLREKFFRGIAQYLT